MKGKSFKKAPWYNHAVAACIAVVLFVLLTRFPEIRKGIGTFFGYFRPVILGIVIAYIVNPLSELLGRSLFRGIKKEKLSDLFSNLLAFIIVLAFLAFLLIMLIPQLIESVETFAKNLDGYLASLNRMLENWGVSKSMFDLDNFISSSENLLEKLTGYFKDNIQKILSMSASAGKSVVAWVIGFILAIYLLAEKRNLKKGLNRLVRGLFGDQRFPGVRSFLIKCNFICKRYIVFNLIDSLIIGSVNAIFMSICGMQYIGLVSFVVAITNLVPTFGPVVGAAIGGFILLMVKPGHALVFLIFTVVLQALDGYVIKPRLFGNTLGVSGLWILVGVIVGGNMFGVVGILLAIPAVAILDLIYRTYFIPWLEKKRGIGAAIEGGAEAPPEEIPPAEEDTSPGEVEEETEKREEE